jgi:hypothetical protein
MATRVLLARVLAKKRLASLAQLAFPSTLFLSYSPNLLCVSTYFFDILAKLDLREYLFLTYLPNLTRRNTCFWHTRQTWLAGVTTSTQNAPQTRLQVLAQVLAIFAKLTLAKFVCELPLLSRSPFFCLKAKDRPTSTSLDVMDVKEVSTLFDIKKKKRENNKRF